MKALCTALLSAFGIGLLSSVSAQVVVRPVVIQAPVAAPAKKPAPPPTPAATPDNPFPIYSDKGRGWHFKELIPEELEPEVPPPPPSVPPSTP